MTMSFGAFVPFLSLSPSLRVRFCPVGNDARTNGTRETRGGRALPAEVTGALDRRSGSAAEAGAPPRARPLPRGRGATQPAAHEATGGPASPSPAAL